MMLAGGVFGEIVSLVVDDTVHGKGIGKGLVNTAVEYPKTKKLNSIRVRCNSLRDEAYKFYEHIGFVENKFQKVSDNF